MEEQWESVTAMSPSACPQMLLYGGCCLLRGNSVSQPCILVVTGSLWSDCQRKLGSDHTWFTLSWEACLTLLGPQESVSLWALCRIESRIWTGPERGAVTLIGGDSSVQMATCAA